MNSQPTLTIDARLINTSGIGVYLQNLLRSERLNRYRLTLLYKDAERDFFNEIARRATMVPYNAGLYSIKELIQTPKYTKGADIFWSPHFNVPLFNFAKKKVVTIHDVFHLAHYDTLSRGQKVYARQMYRKAVKDSDVVFTVSQKSRQEIVKYVGFGEEKIQVAYNGIEFEKFNTPVAAEEKEHICTTYGIRFPFVLFVGNVKPHKNLRMGLLGFKHYLQTHPDATVDLRFVIVGKREGFITGDTTIDELIKDPLLARHVHFSGWVKHEHLPALYQQAAAFVFPSYYEGFGFPPLEAMAAGCPVLSSNASCMPEIYGDAAIFFDPDNEQQIANAFHMVLSDNNVRQSLLAKGLTQARKYHWTTSINQMFDYLEQ